MKRFCNVFFCSLCFYLNLYAQDNATLVPVLEQIKSSLSEVEGKSDTYSQDFSWDEELPYRIKLSISTTNKKGKTEEMAYEFNLRDFDKNTVKVKNDKDLMKVPLFTDNRQKLIKVFKESKQEKYGDKVELIASDIDNARGLEKLFESAITIASKIKPSGLPESFEERMAWLSENIVPITIDETSYNQTFEQDAQLPVAALYTLVKQKSKASESSYRLNLADLKERTIQLKIKGKEVFVEMETVRKLKFIEYTKEDKESKYTNKMEIFVDEPDKGKMLVDVLQGIIPQCQAMEKSRFPEITDRSTGLTLMTEKVGNHEIKDKTFSQSIEEACVTTFTSEETKSKGKSVESKYLFNMGDLNDNKVDIKVGKSGISIQLATGKSKLVQLFKNGELQNYTNKLSILATDVENAKWLLHTIPTTIKHCQEASKNQSLAVKGSSFDWLKENIIEINGGQQVLEKVDDADCKWQLTTTKPGKKGDTEEIYEFNLFDFNPKLIDFKISGKKLAVELFTKHNEKNIKYYKNGEPGDYKNNLLIKMDNIEKARQMISEWKKQIENCKE